MCSQMDKNMGYPWVFGEIVVSLQHRRADGSTYTITAHLKKVE